MKSLVVYARLPDALASLFPPPKVGGLPVHVTLCWVGRFEQDGDVFERACRALDVLTFRADVALGPLNYFPTESGGRVAHVSVDTIRGEDLGLVHDSIVERLADAGIAVEDTFGEGFNPHVTLGWLRTGRIWTGEVPEGEWTIDTFEIRHGHKHYTRV